MKNIANLIILIGVVLFASSCASVGARGHLNFKGLKYPVSLSPALYGKGDKVLIKNKDLKVVKKFKHKKRFWGLAYSWTR
ncbi:MAG: hypothetical protein OEW87_10865, partial [Flavobacteriaceae bacterium]|nr:hypothetical protein [Flavobacteriaceae bacterium]